MKTKNILSAGFALLLAVIFTSCSTSVDIAKRQFNNGYYIHIASKKQVTPVADVVVSKKELRPVIVNEVKIEPVVTTIPVIEKRVEDNLVSVSADKKPALPSIKKRLKEAVASTEIPVSGDNNTEFKAYQKEKRKFNWGLNSLFGGGSVPGIILIVLCILIPPLAVLLEVGVGKEFWIDLLFYLLGFGYLGVLFLGLFWLIAVVYAFIVCFG